MDWLWPIYESYIHKLLGTSPEQPQDLLQETFIRVLTESTATLFIMEPVGDSIIFKALGRWPIPESQELLADPNAFIADRFGGGKYKVNFHHVMNFVGTHNFRTYGDERWREMPEVELE